MRILRYVGVFFVFAWFMVGGALHFLNTDFFVGIMPPYIPYFLHRPLVFFSGAFEILFAFGVLIPFFRRWAGYLLIALTIAVTPANVHMWLNPDLFPEIAESMLAWRLGFQVVLIALIWWSTRSPRGDKRARQTT